MHISRANDGEDVPQIMYSKFLPAKGCIKIEQRVVRNAYLIVSCVPVKQFRWRVGTPAPPLDPSPVPLPLFLRGARPKAARPECSGRFQVHTEFMTRNVIALIEKLHF